ncbi:hypothetical protein D3C80_1308190 [compost metagenome]
MTTTAIPKAQHHSGTWKANPSFTTSRQNPRECPRAVGSGYSTESIRLAMNCPTAFMTQKEGQLGTIPKITSAATPLQTASLIFRARRFTRSQGTHVMRSRPSSTSKTPMPIPNRTGCFRTCTRSGKTALPSFWQ